MVNGLIYLSLPMRGYPGSNFAHGDEVKLLLQRDGWTVVSPVDMDRAQGVTGDEARFSKQKIQNLLRRDITALLTVNAAYFCKGWEASRGCNIEHSIARGIGLECLYEVPPDPQRYLYSWGHAMIREEER